MVIKRLFETLLTEGIIRIKMEAVYHDSTSIKLHPNGRRDIIKLEISSRRIAWMTHNQDSFGHRV